MSQKLIITGAILSYPTLFEPRAYKNGTPKYSAVLVMDTDSTTKLKKIIGQVAVERFGDKAKAVLLGNKPIHDEDQSESKGYPSGTVYINAKSERKPPLVSRYKDPKTGLAAVITEDMATEPDGANEMYPGVIVNAYISVYAFDAEGNKGVAFGLEGLQRWEDAERLDGRVAVANVFDAEMPDEADLEDIMGDEEEAEADPIADIL